MHTTKVSGIGNKESEKEYCKFYFLKLYDGNDQEPRWWHKGLTSHIQSQITEKKT